MGKGIKLVGKLFGVCDCNLHKHSQVLRLALVFLCCFFFFWPNSPQWARASSFTRFLDHTLTHHSQTPLDEGSVRRRDFYLTAHNTHKRQTSMPPVGFEPTVSAGERS